MSVSATSVRVALRVRPSTPVEQQCKEVVEYVPHEPQIHIDARSFTFDYVYPPATQQQDVYDSCVMPLVNTFFEGYNATILAYGQTGSGKTYTMGTGSEHSSTAQDDDGIVPRFIRTLFRQLETKYPGQRSNYQVAVSFLELYNEDLVDLLAPSAANASIASNAAKKEIVIREDAQGQIRWHGVSEVPVDSPAHLFDYLQQGSNARTTASTDMNHSSSRSHAIFSVILKQTVSKEATGTDPAAEPLTPVDQVAPVDKTSTTTTTTTNTIVSKFHFVDLAGSERLKRTNAQGDRAKEGIAINSGLLALGNVISALGDDSKRRVAAHVPYRDSKLTRLLQDSLGGNSQTLMVACVSPAEANVNETLSTLKYANRARNIRNRVRINHDMDDVERLKWTIAKLKEEQRTSDQFARALNDEMDRLQRTVQQLQRTNSRLTQQLQHQRHASESGSIVDSVSDDMHPPSPPLERTSRENEAPPSKSHELPPSASSTSTSDQGKKKRGAAYRFGSIRRSWKGRFRAGSIVGPATSASSSNGTSSAPTAFHSTFTTKAIKALLLQDQQFIQLTMASLGSLGSDDSNEKQTSSKKTSHGASGLAGALQLCQSTLSRYAKSNENQRQWMQQWENVDDRHQEAVRQLERQFQDRRLATATSQSQLKQQLAELTQQHEQKQRKQLTELQTLRRKHTQLVNSSAAMRTQQENTIQQLRTSMDTIKHEKKKMIKRLKQEAQRHQQQDKEWEKKYANIERQLAQTKRQSDRDATKFKNTNKTLTTQIDTLTAAAKKAFEKQDWAILAKQLPGVIASSGRASASASSSTTTAAAAATTRTSAAASAIARAVSINRTASLKRGVHRASSRAVARKRKNVHRQKQHDALEACQQAFDAYSQRPFSLQQVMPLIHKYERLLQEQAELLKERVLIIEAEEPGATHERQYMDDRINQITMEKDVLRCLLEKAGHGAAISKKGGDCSDNKAKPAAEAARALGERMTVDDWAAVGEWLVAQVLDSRTDHRFALVISGQLEKLLSRHQAAWEWLHQQADASSCAALITRAQQQCLETPAVIDQGLLLLDDERFTSPSAVTTTTTTTVDATITTSRSDMTISNNHTTNPPAGYLKGHKIPVKSATTSTLQSNTTLAAN